MGCAHLNEHFLSPNTNDPNKIIWPTKKMKKNQLKYKIHAIKHVIVEPPLCDKGDITHIDFYKRHLFVFREKN